VERNKADVLLLSGGLDSSILAALSPKTEALTVRLEGSGAPDIEYAQQVAAIFGLKHQIKGFTIAEALQSLPQIIRILKSFAPIIPNIATYSALKLAKGQGAESVMTGDGADEFFCGYSYMLELGDSLLDKYIRKLNETTRFPSNMFGEYLGLQIKQPYLDEKVREFALQIEPSLKIGVREGQTHGKWVLRQAFQDCLPGRIVWRGKLAMEYGSGAIQLREVFNSRISDAELEEKAHRYNLKLIEGAEKEQLFCYEVYRAVVGEIPQPAPGEMKCPGCGAGIPCGFYHCHCCGFSVL